jgi:hypothetical protein
MKNNITRFAILLVTLFLTQTVFADVKIKTRQTSSGQTSEYTTYIKGKRMRTEQKQGEMQTVNLTQCDLKRGVRLMPQAQTYMIDSWEQAPSVEPTTTTTSQKQAVTKGGVITMTVTTKDTGERKQMFGYTAKHIITTIESASSPDACNVRKTKMEMDGWYIDAAFVLNCESEHYGRNYRNQVKEGCQDRYETKQIGKPKTGYPVLEKMTIFDDSGKESYSTLSEVLELSSSTLDAALFDVPQGYREVKDSTELYASMASSSSSSGDSSSGSSTSSRNMPSMPGGNNSAMNSNIQNLSKSAPSAASEVGAKKAGVVRIGLAAVKTGAVGEGLNAAELAGAIRNTLSEYLKSPKIELVALEAKLASAIDAEAKEKECDFVIYAQVSHKKGGGGGMFGKMLGSVASSTISRVGYGSGNVAGQVAGQVASEAVYTASTMSANVKSKDEITLDIKVNSAAGAAALAKQFKQKAKGDGDDIITPIIEQAAQAILDAVAK